MRRRDFLSVLLFGILHLFLPHGTGVQRAVALAAEPTVSLWTCGMHPEILRREPGTCPICGMELTPVRVSGESVAPDVSAVDSDLLTIDPVLQQNLGVRTERVVEGPLRQAVRVLGTFVEPESARIDVNLRVGGWVEALHAKVEGGPVRVGEPLLDVYSPELTVAAEEFVALWGSARRGGAGELDPEIGRAARDRLIRLGLDAGQVRALEKSGRVPRTFRFHSPVTGHVRARRIVEGAAFSAGETLLELSDRSRLWLDLSVPEPDAALVAPGVPVEARTAAVPGRTWTGSVHFLHPYVDPGSRTILARVEVENPEGLLRQGMTASAVIRGTVAERARLVPREAVIDTGVRQVAFVVRGPGRFELREVKAGREAERGQLEVLAGLEIGEEVVTSGQFLLDAESRLREVARKFLDPGTTGPSPTGENRP